MVEVVFVVAVAENGENSMRETCESINRMLGFDGPPSAMTMQEATGEWSEGTAEDTMASNSRVRARRARRELGWLPQARGLIEEIAEGGQNGYTHKLPSRMTWPNIVSSLTMSASH